MESPMFFHPRWDFSLFRAVLFKMAVALKSKQSPLDSRRVATERRGARAGGKMGLPNIHFRELSENPGIGAKL